MKKGNGVDIELSDQELDYLKKIHVAQTLADFMRHPGWELFNEIVTGLVARLEDQHLNFAESSASIPARDAYWVSGMRLGGVRRFAKILQEDIRKRVDILNQPLQPPTKPDLADFDGDLSKEN